MSLDILIISDLVTFGCQTKSKKLTFIQTKSQVKRNTRYPFIYDDNINLFSLALNINSQQDLLIKMCNMNLKKEIIKILLI